MMETFQKYFRKYFRKCFQNTFKKHYGGPPGIPSRRKRPPGENPEIRRGFGNGFHGFLWRCRWDFDSRWIDRSPLWGGLRITCAMSSDDLRRSGGLETRAGYFFRAGLFPAPKCDQRAAPRENVRREKFSRARRGSRPAGNGRPGKIRKFLFSSPVGVRPRTPPLPAI